MLDICIIGRRKTGELSFVKPKPIYRLLVLKKLFNVDFEGLTR